MRRWFFPLLLLLAACGDDEGGTTPAATCDQAPQSVTREVPGSNGLAMMKIQATRGCASLDVPIAAMNWFSVSDPDALLAYNTVASQLVSATGARILVAANSPTALDVPDGTTPTGGPWLHTELAIPLYPSAATFLEMVTSPEFMAAPDKGLGVQEHYEFSFQECLANCDPDGPQFPLHLTGPFLLQHMTIDRQPVVDALASMDGVVYAGYRLADFKSVIGEEEGPATPWMEPAWGDATIVYQVDDMQAAEALTLTEPFQTMASQASQQSLVMVETALK